MALDATLSARDGVKNFRHSVTDVVAYDFPYEQSRDKDTYNRIDQIQPVGPRGIEIFCQEFLDVFHQELQYIGGQCRKDTDQKAQYQHELLVFDVLFSPCEEIPQDIVFVFCYFHNGS